MTLPTYVLLIVEQSSAVREQYQCDLQANSICNYKWLVATSIAAAVELCRTSAIDIVLLGESFGNSNGLTFLEAWSDRDPGSRPGVVMIAATVDARVAVRAIKLGAEDYLVKPVTANQLRSAVQTALETARSQWQTDRQGEAQIRRILDSLFSFVGILTPDGTLIEANRTALEAAQLLPEDVIGQPFPNAYWWSYDAAIQAQLWTAIHQAAAGVTVRYDVSVRLGTEHFITIDFGLTPLLNESGQVEFLIPSGIDITDRKEMEASLDLSEEQLRMTTEAVDLGLWFWHLKDDRLVWTTCCKRLFGLDADTEITYGRFLSTLHPEDRDRTNAAVQCAIRQKTPYTIEYRTVWSDQSIHWILAQARVSYDNQHQPIRMIGTAQDITAQKQAEVTLQGYADELNQINMQLMKTTEIVTQRNQELDQYAHIVSHDLKAPLRAIANLSQWIEEDLEGILPAPIKEQMTLLRSQVYRMEGMINGLLDYARVGRTGSAIHLVAVEELLLEVIATTMPPPTFSVTFNPDLPIVYAKPLLLSQVFSNLIDNAIKHHDRIDGSVHVSVADRGNFYEFAIVDDGPGIAQEYQGNVFTIFHTASPKNKKDSTGIGLAIVKKIVETEGGAIWLESEVDRGTAFYFTWPK